MGKTGNRVLTVLAVLSFIMLLPLTAKAEVTKAWANTTASSHDVTTDSSGNVYTSSTSSLTKHSPDGVKLWEIPLENPNRGSYPQVGTDSDGNVYIGDAHYNAFKVDPDGNLLWMSRPTTPLFQNDTGDGGYAFAVDASGSTYISGWLGSIAATVKYTTDGQVAWVSTYGDGSGWYGPMGLSLDSSGNVLVVAQTYDYPIVAQLILKYGPSGNLIWENSNACSVRCVPNRIDTDKDGNVYTTGSFSDTSGRGSFVTKVDSNGTLVWHSPFDSGDNYPSGITVDTAGNSYVSGRAKHPTTGSSALNIIKLDASGTVVWNNFIDNMRIGFYSHVMDKWGNLYMSGTSRDRNNVYSLKTVKVDTDGNLLWAMEEAGVNVYSYSEPIHIDNKGGIYALGLINYPSRSGFIVKYTEPVPVSTPADVSELITEMLGSGAIANAGIANALTQLLANAEANIESSPSTAANMIEAAIKLISAQSGKQIDSASADELIGYLEMILAGL